MFKTLAFNNLTLTLALITPLFAQNSWAFETSHIDIRGFGTAGFTLENQDYTLPEYGAFGKTANLSKLSLIGLNVHALINSEWDVASQFEARSDTADVNLYLNWGFLSWHPNSNFAIRAGRLTNPFWLYSQQIDVGFSYPWTTLPAEVYSLTTAFKAVNGISFLASREVGNGTLQAELVAGESPTVVKNADPLAATQTTVVTEVKNLLALDLKYEYDHHLTTRIAYAQAEAVGQVESRSLSTTGMPAGSYLGSTVITPVSMGRAQFLSTGYNYDSDTFFSGSEVVRRLIAGPYVARATAYYGMIGYHIAKWSPFYTYSAQVDVQGTGMVSPINVTNTTSLLKGIQTHIIGLNYSVNDSVLVKTGFSTTHEDYSASSSNFDFKTYQASVNFVF